MDFVVVGLGLGALAILGGIVLLGVLAGRWEREAARAAVPEDAAYRSAMAAERRVFGQSLIWAGAAMFLATVGALAGALDDRTGALLVTTTATVAAAGILVREYLYRVRHPRPRRPRQPLAPASALSSATLSVPSPDPSKAAVKSENETLAAVPAPDASVGPEQMPGDGDAFAAFRDALGDALAGEAIEPQAYSFMRDAPEAEDRKSPYSFMLDQDDLGEPAVADDLVAGEMPDGGDIQGAAETGHEEERATEEAAMDQPEDADDARVHPSQQRRFR